MKQIILMRGVRNKWRKIQLQITVYGCFNVIWHSFTAHQANAAEQPQNQSNHKNVLDDQTALKQAEKKLKAKLHNQLQMYLVHKHIKTLPKFNLNKTHKVLHMMHH